MDGTGQRRPIHDVVQTYLHFGLNCWPSCSSLINFVASILQFDQFDQFCCINPPGDLGYSRRRQAQLSNVPTQITNSHSVRLSVCPSVRLSVCPSVRLSVCRSVGLSVGQSVCLSVCLSVCPMYLCIYESMYPWFYVSINQWINQSIGRSINQSINQINIHLYLSIYLI